MRPGHWGCACPQESLGRALPPQLPRPRLGSRVRPRSLARTGRRRGIPLRLSQRQRGQSQGAVLGTAPTRIRHESALQHRPPPCGAGPQIPGRRCGSRQRKRCGGLSGSRRCGFRLNWLGSSTAASLPSPLVAMEARHGPTGVMPHTTMPSETLCTAFIRKRRQPKLWTCSLAAIWRAIRLGAETRRGLCHRKLCNSVAVWLLPMG